MRAVYNTGSGEAGGGAERQGRAERQLGPEEGHAFYLYLYSKIGYTFCFTYIRTVFLMDVERQFWKCLRECILKL